MKTRTIKDTLKDAAKEYNQRHNHAIKLLRKIEAALEKHESEAVADSLHWGHVGDLGHVNEDLQKVADFLQGYMD